LPRVLHILDSLNRGGAEIMMLDLCRNAAANGLDLTFVATGGGDLESDFRNSGVPFVRLQRRLPVDLRLAGELRDIITEQKIEVVHGHQPVEALHLYLAARSLKVKRVLTLHGFYPGSKNELALRFVLPRMDRCVVVSEEVLRLVREKRWGSKANFVVINNGVDPKRLRGTAVPPLSLRDELGLDPSDHLFGMIGNFQPVAQKDQLTICRALPEVFKSVAATHFVFVGGRSETTPQLFDDCVTFCRSAGIAERVHFVGKRSDIGEILGSLDLFVLSTLREGSPISVIEAMMMGVPCVLSDIDPLQEISADGKYAALFETGNADDLAARMIQLHGDAAKRQGLARSAADWANTRFSIEAHIANLIELYGGLLLKQ
jgi:glycosyltransferase involved in cell wall biosynthesis